MKSYFKMTMVNIGIKTRSWVSSTIFWQGNERATFMQLCEMWILFSKSPVLLAMWIVVFGTWHCFDLWICGSEYLWLVLVGECNSWRQPQPPFYLPTIASSQLAATCGRPGSIFRVCAFLQDGHWPGQAKANSEWGSAAYEVVFILRTQLLGIGNRRKSQ